MPLGLYIHVPFCKSKCLYCDFYSVRFDPEVNREYLRCLCAEIEARRGAAESYPLTTVFFGGGTPSLLSIGELTTILGKVGEAFPASPEEMTLECNPGTLTEDYLAGLLSTGINRLSLGLQSLDPGELRTLGRTHTAEEGVNAFRMARRAGFQNISVDLIFGVPGQRLSGWKETLAAVTALAPEHVSVYELTLDGPTPLRAGVESGRVHLLPEELLEEMYGLAARVLEEAGLRQYEISNFARPGAECRHNLNCWNYGEYIGVGPSAHSFINGRRSWNLADVAGYTAAVTRTGLAEAGHESLSPREAEFERTMLALRMRKGVARNPLPELLAGAFHDLLAAGFLEESGGRIRLTARGMLLSNEVFLRLR